MNLQEDALPKVNITIGPSSITEKNFVEVNLEAIVPESFVVPKEINPKIDYVVITHGFKYDSLEEQKAANMAGNSAGVLRRAIYLPLSSLENVVSQMTHKLKIEGTQQVAEVSVIIFNNGSRYCGELGAIYRKQENGTYVKD